MASNNYAKKNYQDFRIEEGFYILKIYNNSDSDIEIKREVNKSYIQLHFCIQNSAKLVFKNGGYALDIPKNKSFLLYNPQEDLPIHLKVSPDSKMISLLISIKKFHTFFTQEAGLIHFLNDENKNKKYYYDKDLNPNKIIVLNQLFHFGLHSSLEKLYTKGKVYELLSLYFNKSDDDSQNCPFLEDEMNVEKIQNAKKVLIENMVEPLSLNELADAISLPLQHLKDGFKQIYGETVFTYLFNYKMEYARKLLASKKYNISEISFKIGYSTPSHFIAAFKKKYGSTPKKYMSSL